MKDVKKNLEAIGKDIKKITDKIEKLVAGFGKMEKPKAKAVKAKTAKKAPAKKAAPKKKQQVTAFDKVIQIVRRSKKGVSAAQLKAKTGFDDKKIANIIYKAKKNGLIQSKTKGVYVKV
jgi:hypothetical protein